MKVDPAIVSFLGLDPENCTLSSGGGAGMSSASTSKITANLPDGSSKSFFLKSGHGKDAEIMFKGEHASLNAIHDAVPSLCPKSFGHGKFVDGSKSFLVTDWVDLTSRPSSRGSCSGMSLAQKLAKLHTTPAAIPTGYDRPQFGFEVPTCCGDTVQDNTYSDSWADFYANCRLRFIGKQARRRNGNDPQLDALIEQTCNAVVPRLIADNHLNNGRRITPVVVHGDLWSGNASRGKLPGMAEAEDIVYDSSACFAHSEFELGIMRMFGGFGDRFLKEYHSLVPKTEPVGEYEDRIALYELYHHLNHYSLFGGGYKGGAMKIMKTLIAKYGDGDGGGRGGGGAGGKNEL